MLGSRYKMARIYNTLFPDMRRVDVPPAKNPQDKRTQMALQFMPSGEVVWYQHNGESYIRNGYMSNNAVFTVIDWIAKKVATAPVYLYEIEDKKAYTKYQMLLKDATPESVDKAMVYRKKALKEVDAHPLLDMLNKPNPIMRWYEMVYGHVVYKNIVGSSYWQGVRTSGDGLTGKIEELWLLPAHDITIKLADDLSDIEEYSFNSRPTDIIKKKNVMQVRNFMPAIGTQNEWLYGMSKLKPLMRIIQEYNEATDAKVEIFAKKGIRDIVFPANGDWAEDSMEMAIQAQDNLNRKIVQSGETGVAVNSVALGSIRIGFTPTELGVVESQKISKTDICSAFGVPDLIFGWGAERTFQNMSEARKMGLIDAVLPEIEALRQSLNHWLIPSWFPNDQTGYVLDFDIESFAEMQKDTKTLTEWIDRAGCFTTNEKRIALGYDSLDEENANKILISRSQVLLESAGIESFDIGQPFEPNNEPQRSTDTTRQV